jgi:hypothetical protein
MSDYLTAREAQAKRAVDQLPDAAVLEADHSELVQDLLEKVRVRPIDFRWDDMYQDKPKETDITVRDFGFDEVLTARGTSLTVHVPFTGEPDLLGVQPTSFTLNPPRGSAKNSELLLTWEGRSGEPGQVKGWLDDLTKRINDYAEWSKRDIDVFNGKLHGLLGTWLQQRKAHLERNQQLASALDIPIGRKPAPAPDLVSVPKRRPIAVQPQDIAEKVVQRELRISDDDYAAIVEQLSSARGLLERLPETFSPMGEEALRDLLLVILNNQFGPAGGEMFSRKGKTDIVILRDKGAVFIAECKNWEGVKAFREAIEQLLGYLVWRDTKAALVVFVREKDVTTIAEKALVELSGHAHHLARGNKIGDIPTEVLHHEGDPRRHIRVALLIVPIPPVA